MPALLIGCVSAGIAQHSDPELLIKQNHWKRARAIVEERYRAMPHDAETNFLLSQIRYAFGDRTAPLKFAEQAVALNGHVGKYHRQLAEVLGVQAQHAGPLQQIFLARRFRKEMDLALALEPLDIQALRDLEEFYLLAPGIVGGDWGKAAATAERITQIDTAAGFLAKARIAEQGHRTIESESMLRKAVAAEPPSYRARVELAEWCLHKDHSCPETPERAARGALELDRTRVDAYAILAVVYADRADWDALEAILTEAARQVPDDLVPYYRAADHLLGNHRDPARAERYLRVYLGQEPEGNEPTAADARWKLGLDLESQGREAEAIAEWKEAVRRDPASPAARELRHLHLSGVEAVPASEKRDGS